ncbi:MAG: hypothetical protein LC750_09110 [Actinobacteria bacterium]|nr:hypothetical protein [Actinomycetota bacterium]
MGRHRWAVYLGLSLVLTACGAGPSSSHSSQGNPTLRLDDSTSQIVLTNNTGRPMLAGSTFGLEERSGSGWVNADSTLARLLGVDAVAGTADLIELPPSGEYRYGITYLHKLPAGEYRVTVATGEKNPKNELPTPQTLTFTR